MELAKYIDHTLLKPTAVPEDIIKLCSEARKYQFHAVCVNSSHLALAEKELRDSEVAIAAVIGFPLGAMASTVKVFETQFCMDHGADEVDMVLNIGWLKAGMHNKVQDEISRIKEITASKILKVIIETCYLSEEEKEAACAIVAGSGADFIKTSTGFGTGGATYEDVQLMKRLLPDAVKIKASGGIKDRATARKYLEIGASRLGTSSGIAIVKETNP
ncbi:MAG: deoxyribose-phosphate aldolase [Bacteroidota bacterium]